MNATFNSLTRSLNKKFIYPAHVKQRKGCLLLEIIWNLCTQRNGFGQRLIDRQIQKLQDPNKDCLGELLSSISQSSEQRIWLTQSILCNIIGQTELVTFAILGFQCTSRPSSISTLNAASFVSIFSLYSIKKTKSLRISQYFFHAFSKYYKN